MEELEEKLANLESQATRCDRSGDFDHFISHNWLPLQSMVFSWIEYPHCSASKYTFPTPSCARPMYGDGGLAVVSRLWSQSSIPPLEPVELTDLLGVLRKAGELWKTRGR